MSNAFLLIKFNYLFMPTYHFLKLKSKNYIFSLLKGCKCKIQDTVTILTDKTLECSKNNEKQYNKIILYVQYEKHICIIDLKIVSNYLKFTVLQTRSREAFLQIR